MNRIIYRYIFIELIPPFILSIVFFTFILLLSQILELTNYIVNYQFDTFVALKLIMFNLPFTMQFIVPLSAMLSVLLTFLRMSADLEIIAIKGGGIALYHLLPPVLVFAVLCSLMTAFTSIFALPYGRTTSKQLIINNASKLITAALKPGEFINEFKDIVLYFHEINPSSKTLKNVFLEKRHSKDLVTTVVAPRGLLVVQPEQLVVHFRLFDGNMFQVNVRDGSANTQSFGTYDVRLDLKQNVKFLRDQKQAKDEEEMSLKELHHYIQTTLVRNDQYYISLMEWYKKFSLPVACIVLSVLAVPLGIQARSSKRSYGIGLAMLFYFLFYILLSIGWVFGETGEYPPIIGMWVPNVVMAILGVIFWIGAIREMPIFLPPLGRWFRILIHRREDRS
jgi:lipopolysaccharide export system permease protein